MLAEYEGKSRPFLWGGFIGALVLRIAGTALIAVDQNALGILLTVLSVVAFAVFIYGCTLYARAKGYSPWLGLVGISGLIGIIVLAVIPDKHKSGVAVGSAIPGTLPPPPYAPPTAPSAPMVAPPTEETTTPQG